jgi:hypothetical protein
MNFKHIVLFSLLAIANIAHAENDAQTIALKNKLKELINMREKLDNKHEELENMRKKMNTALNRADAYIDITANQGKECFQIKEQNKDLNDDDITECKLFHKLKEKELQEFTRYMRKHKRVLELEKEHGELYNEYNQFHDTIAAEKEVNPEIFEKVKAEILTEQE